MLLGFHAHAVSVTLGIRPPSLPRICETGNRHVSADPVFDRKVFAILLIVSFSNLGTSLLERSAESNKFVTCGNTRRR